MENTDNSPNIQGAVMRYTMKQHPELLAKEIGCKGKSMMSTLYAFQFVLKALWAAMKVGFLANFVRKCKLCSYYFTV